ncbi:MAG: ABC transporter substrate-binding protein [Pseudomonadota bacterium]
MVHRVSLILGHSLSIFGYIAFFMLATTAPSKSGTIGLSIPLSGDAAELGQSFRTGAKLAMEIYGSNHQLFITDDGCDADLAALATEDMKSQNVDIVLGLICNAPAKIVANAFVESKTPVIVAGARSVRLIKDREREAWNLWRMSPGDDYAVEVAANAIRALWQTTPYAIVDDGTIYGRSFTDALRIKMDEFGLEPQFSDTFRAAQSTQAGLLRRLQRSGVTAAFIASATKEDLLTIGQNMAEFEIDLDLIASEALVVLPFLEEASRVASGLKVVMAPMPEDETLDALLKERDIDPDQQIYNGFAAVQIATQVLGNTELLRQNDLSGIVFETVLGGIQFNENGSSSYNPYELHEWDGEVLAPSKSEAETQ